MSTICKLDANVRENRRRRKAVCQELMQAPDNTRRLQRVGALLDKFRRLPTFTGAEKQTTFGRVLNDLKKGGMLA